jgi:hypothetical protein
LLQPIVCKTLYEGWYYQTLVSDNSHSLGKANQDRRKILRHTQYITFQLTKIAVPEKLLRKTLKRIDNLQHLPETVQKMSLETKKTKKSSR